MEVLQDNLSHSTSNTASLDFGNRFKEDPFKALSTIFAFTTVFSDSPRSTFSRSIIPLAGCFSSLLHAARRRERLREYFLTYGAPELDHKLYTELTELKLRKKELDRQIPTVMVMQEAEKPRDTTCSRAATIAIVVKVLPGVPSALPPLPKDATPNRLGLARWLVSESHPLTARGRQSVLADVLWKRRSENRRGLRIAGEMPVHRELLDWLATELFAAVGT